MGKLDNTLIIYISGDNGTSAEGTLGGTPNQMTAYNGILNLPEVEQMLNYEAWGSDKTYPHMSVAWSWAFDTPFKWTKQVASHFGGTRQGMAISWPGHIKDVGGIRTQFHHMIDIVPTILEATGIQAPDMVNGIAQRPIEGVSMAYTFDQANANAPSKRTTQYFEMFAQPRRSTTMAGMPPRRRPPRPGSWERPSCPRSTTTSGNSTTSPKTSRKTTTWRPRIPTSCKELQALFLTEAAKYNVFPIGQLAPPAPRLRRGRARPPGELFSPTSGENAGIPVGNAPSILNKDYTITAEVTIPEGGAEDMIVTLGGRFGGYGLYLLKGKPVFVYNLARSEALPLGGWRGRRRLCWAVRSSRASTRSCSTSNTTGPAPARAAPGVLTVDGKELARKTIPHTIPMLMSIDETFDVGIDTRTAVDDSYKLPFRFTGTIDKLTFKLGPYADDGGGRQGHEGSALARSEWTQARRTIRGK